MESNGKSEIIAINKGGRKQAKQEKKNEKIKKSPSKMRKAAA